MDMESLIHDFAIACFVIKLIDSRIRVMSRKKTPETLFLFVLFNVLRELAFTNNTQTATIPEQQRCKLEIASGPPQSTPASRKFESANS